MDQAQVGDSIGEDTAVDEVNCQCPAVDGHRAGPGNRAGRSVADLQRAVEHRRSSRVAIDPAQDRVSDAALRKCAAAADRSRKGVCARGDEMDQAQVGHGIGEDTAVDEVNCQCPAVDRHRTGPGNRAGRSVADLQRAVEHRRGSRIAIGPAQDRVADAALGQCAAAADRSRKGVRARGDEMDQAQVGHGVGEDAIIGEVDCQCPAVDRDRTGPGNRAGRSVADL